MSDQLQLYSYWRSSAAYRVRIGLNLKGLSYETLPIHLLRNGGEQHAPDYVDKNPQHLVPTLLHGNRVVRQSLAILEYLDEAWPSPRLLPVTARDRARVRALAQMITSDIHPLNNLRVLQYLEKELQVTQTQRDEWVRHWIVEGFRAIEQVLNEGFSSDLYCHGESPGLADCCLVPQIYNARRFGVDMAVFPAMSRIEQACLSLPAFDSARPELQPDAA